MLPFNYSQAWLHGDSEVRRRWVEQLTAIGYMEGPFVREGGPQVRRNMRQNRIQRRPHAPATHCFCVNCFWR